LFDKTGNHAELEVACSLNLPVNARSISSSVKAQMAEPMRPVVDVVKTP
jgi:hypothetical protein